MRKKPTWEEQMNMANLVVVEKWLTQIGLQIQQDPCVYKGFFYGIKVNAGTIFYNPRTATVADLLHEAGHVAVIPGKVRSLLGARLIDKHFYQQASEILPKLEFDNLVNCGEEAAIFWSYCAAIALSINPLVLFEVGFENEAILHYLQTSPNSELPSYSGIVNLYQIGLLDKISNFPKLRVWLNNW